MFLIGIAGGSGSGKTTLAKKILQRVADPALAILHQDAYYLLEPPQHLLRADRSNFDHPDAFDWPLFELHLKHLKEGRSVEVPTYDYKVSRRLDQKMSLGPCRAVLMEGIYALWSPAIRELIDIKVYLDVESDIRFIRRLHRDVKERGRSLDGIIRQYYDTVRPMHHEFLAPTQQYADMIIREEHDRAADLLAAKIKQVLQGT